MIELAIVCVCVCGCVCACVCGVCVCVRMWILSFTKGEGACGCQNGPNEQRFDKVLRNRKHTCQNVDFEVQKGGGGLRAPKWPK